MSLMQYPPILTKPEGDPARLRAAASSLQTVVSGLRLTIEGFSGYTAQDTDSKIEVKATGEELWSGVAADRYARTTLSHLAVMRDAAALLQQGADALETLAGALDQAQAAVSTAQDIAQHRARTAEAELALAPITYWDEQQVAQLANGLAERARLEAAATFERLRNSAPGYVPPAVRAAEGKEENPWWKQAYEGIKESDPHLLLDGAGLVPGYGEPFDLANAVWYGVEGDWTMAGLSAGSMIPIAGYAGTAGKVGARAERAAGAGKRIDVPSSHGAKPVNDTTKVQPTKPSPDATPDPGPRGPRPTEPGEAVPEGPRTNIDVPTEFGPPVEVQDPTLIDALRRAQEGL